MDTTDPDTPTNPTDPRKTLRHNITSRPVVHSFAHNDHVWHTNRHVAGVVATWFDDIDNTARGAVVWNGSAIATELTPQLACWLRLPREYPIGAQVMAGDLGKGDLFGGNRIQRVTVTGGGMYPDFVSVRMKGGTHLDAEYRDMVSVYPSSAIAQLRAQGMSVGDAWVHLLAQVVCDPAATDPARRAAVAALRKLPDWG